MYEHLISHSYTGTKSLKLGFKTRKEVKSHLKCYIGIIPSDIDSNMVESNIRKKFGTYFGEK